MVPAGLSFRLEVSRESLLDLRGDLVHDCGDVYMFCGKDACQTRYHC
jgi:hypothetical protein